VTTAHFFTHHAKIKAKFYIECRNLMSARGEKSQ